MSLMRSSLGSRKEVWIWLVNAPGVSLPAIELQQTDSQQKLLPSLPQVDDVNTILPLLQDVLLQSSPLFHLPAAIEAYNKMQNKNRFFFNKSSNLNNVMVLSTIIGIIYMRMRHCWSTWEFLHVPPVRQVHACDGAWRSSQARVFSVTVSPASSKSGTSLYRCSGVILTRVHYCRPVLLEQQIVV